MCNPTFSWEMNAYDLYDINFCHFGYLHTICAQIESPIISQHISQELPKSTQFYIQKIRIFTSKWVEKFVFFT